MAARAPIDIEIYQGGTYDVTRTWKAGTPAVPVDLTGCTARMQIRSRMNSPVPLLNLTTENGGLVLGGAAGTIQTIITEAQTAALPAKSAVYDVEIVFTGGVVRPLYGGTGTVHPEVTRPEGVV